MCITLCGKGLQGLYVIWTMEVSVIEGVTVHVYNGHPFGTQWSCLKYGGVHTLTIGSVRFTVYTRTYSWKSNAG